MTVRVKAFLLLALFVTEANLVNAQHCGGPCEGPRCADPVSFNPKYSLSQGVEAADWRYLYNWFWTVDGVQKHRVESALKSSPAVDFGFRRMFVSPSGNGFLVTGNSYAGRRLNGNEAPLFVFIDPEGNQVSTLSLFDACAAKSRRPGACPNCNCKAVLYVFAEDPTLSENGVFVELYPYKALSTVTFYLPFGCVVQNRQTFEQALEAAEWSRLSTAEAEREHKAIQRLLAELNSEDLGVRTAAARSLLHKGFLALSAIRLAYHNSDSGNFRARAKAVEMKLRPLGGLPFEAMSTDLGVLSSMVTYEEADVAQSVSRRLQKLVPDLKDVPLAQYGEWIYTHKQQLKWNVNEGRYE